MKKRKTIAMLVRVTVPVGMKPSEARREVRTMIGCQCNYSADVGDVRVLSCVKAADIDQKATRS